MEAWHKHGFLTAANLQSKSKIHFMTKLTKAKTNRTLIDCQVRAMNAKVRLMKENMKLWK